MRVLKHTLELHPGVIQTLELDEDTWVLRSDFQRVGDKLELQVWATDRGNERTPIDFLVLATGQEAPEANGAAWEPLSTVLTADGQLVFHVFVCDPASVDDSDGEGRPRVLN